jgi:hypothetical protein
VTIAETRAVAKRLVTAVGRSNTQRLIMIVCLGVIVADKEAAREDLVCAAVGSSLHTKRPDAVAPT